MVSPRVRVARSSTFLRAGFVAAALAMLAPSAALAQAPADAKAQLAAGDKAAKAKSWDAAIAAYTAAKAQNPSLEAMSGLANALYEKGDAGKAYEAYEDLIRTHVGKLTKDQRATAEKRLKELGQKSGPLTVTSTEAGADIAIDGVAVGKAPLERPVRLSIGEHKVSAKKPGFAPFEAQVTISGNTAATVAAKLSAEVTKGKLKVREADGKVRIAVELSDAQTARVLWSERFDREGGKVFEIQDSIVRNIVGALAIKVTKLESDRAAARPPSRREAYDLVLLARSLELKAERAANRQGRALVAQARELAPDYSMAYVVESELEVQRAAAGWMENPAQGLMLAERAARHALTIDDPGANARAHAVLGYIHTFRREYDRSLAESERAMALNPSDTSIAERRADTLLWVGRAGEAIALMERALRLDPAGRNSPVRHTIVPAYFVAERYPEALAACERALADHPDVAYLHALRAAILAQMGRLEEAGQAATEMRRLQPNFPAEELGGRFQDPAIRDRLQAALRKAGL